MAAPPPQRWAASIEYDGCRLHGFQRQPNREATVQAFLEAALSSIAACPIRVFCAGRTDARVHATRQIVHFDAPCDRPADAWVRGGNSQLDVGIALHWATPVPETFHARFSAEARRYQFLVRERSLPRGLGRDYVLAVAQELDVAAMAAAAATLQGEHDFTSYRAAGCQSRSARRTVERFAVYRANGLVVFDIQANAFLLHMVRNLVGTLLQVGSGDRAVGWPAAVLGARDRRSAGPTAAPVGLYLVEVRYPAAFGLACGYRAPWFLDEEADVASIC